MHVSNTIYWYKKINIHFTDIFIWPIRYSYGIGNMFGKYPGKENRWYKLEDFLFIEDSLTRVESHRSLLVEHDSPRAWTSSW